MRRIKTKRITKFEKQWREIKRRRINITKREFREYYDNLRKANRKIGSKNFKSKAIDKRKLSYSIKYIKSKADFKSAVARVDRILTRKYLQEQNERIRQKFYNALEYAFDLSEANTLTNLFSQLSDNELAEFMQENPDIEHIQYASKERLDEYVELIGLSVEKIEDRITFKYKNIRI